MIKQSAFIRVNTPEVGKRLEEIGYTNRNDTTRGNAIVSGIKDNNKITSQYMCFDVDDDFLSYIMPLDKIKDCGENIDVFIKCASMTD